MFFINSANIDRTEVCTLLLGHGADPTLVNCHSKTAIDLAPSEELKQRIDCELFASPLLSASVLLLCR